MNTTESCKTINLNLLALQWLHWERRCPIVLRERSPRCYYCGNPDVMGITRDRYMLEIEIKRSLQDFKADAKKTSRINRDLYLDKAPRQFYYLIPFDLLEAVQPMLPPWAGLMTAGNPNVGGIQIQVIAPVNKLSARVPIKECVHLTHMLSNYNLALEQSLDRVHQKYARGAELAPWNWHFQI